VVTTRETKPLECNHGLHRQAVARTLLTEVFQGQIRAGQRLVAQELAKRFGVSPTPIREALIELAGTGIIDLLPNRGAIVRRVTTSDVREVCQIRRALECEAVRSACGRIALADLHALAADLRRLIAVRPPLHAEFIDEARGIDSRLHDLIAEACGNRLLANELGRFKTLFRAFRDVSWAHDEARHDFHRVAEEAREHLAIVEALLAGDAKQASRAMALHIRSGNRYWSRSVEAAPNGSPDSPPLAGRPKRSTPA
jgi:DNA-binding GntR family transcriptional regulator